MKQLSALSILLVIFALTLCHTAIAKEKKPKEQKMLTLEANIPTLEPVEGYPWDQTKDAVSIKLTPEPFVHKVQYERSLKEKREFIKVNSNTKYEITETPNGFVVRPGRLMLQIHAVNNTSHVLRFHGSVVDLKADGKSLPIDPTTVEELTKAVLTPYSAIDVTLTGPEVDNLAQTKTIIFAIYDVITEVDAANNPTKRTTFEWIFSVRPRVVREELAVEVREERLSDAQVRSLEKYFIAE